MKKDITNNSHLKLLPALDTISERESAYLNSGQKNRALIPMQDRKIYTASKLRQLSELLNYLEKEVATLQFKLLEVCSTLTDDHNTEDLPAKPGSFTSDIIGTDE